MHKQSTAERLKKIMSERNLKQVDILNLAEPYCKMYKIRLGRNDLSQYVAGKVEPRQNKLYILGRALNVNEAWLMGLDVPMERNSDYDLMLENKPSDTNSDEFVFYMYRNLDDDDKAEVRGVMKQMFKSDKYEQIIDFDEKNKI